MKKTAIITGSFLLAITAGFIASDAKGHNKSSRTEGLMKTMIPGSDSTTIKRGAYLVAIMGCDDCHSPKVMGAHGPEPDPARRLSGHPGNQPITRVDTGALRSWVLFDMGQTAAVGPWGISYAANITSDETGIGSWNESQFITAIRKGKFKGLENSRSLLPPMPWPGYAQSSDEDLKAIFAFLKSTKAVHNVVPEAVPPHKLPVKK